MDSIMNLFAGSAPSKRASPNPTPAEDATRSTHAVPLRSGVTSSVHPSPVSVTKNHDPQESNNGNNTLIQSNHTSSNNFTTNPNTTTTSEPTGFPFFQRWPSPTHVAGQKRALQGSAAQNLENTKSSRTDDREHAPSIILREVKALRPLQRKAAQMQADMRESSSSSSSQGQTAAQGNKRAKPLRRDRSSQLTIPVNQQPPIRVDRQPPALGHVASVDALISLEDDTDISSTNGDDHTRHHGNGMALDVPVFPQQITREYDIEPRNQHTPTPANSARGAAGMIMPPHDTTYPSPYAAGPPTYISQPRPVHPQQPLQYSTSVSVPQLRNHTGYVQYGETVQQQFHAPTGLGKQSAFSMQHGFNAHHGQAPADFNVQYGHALPAFNTPPAQAHPGTQRPAQAHPGTLPPAQAPTAAPPPIQAPSAALPRTQAPLPVPPYFNASSTYDYNIPPGFSLPQGAHQQAPVHYYSGQQVSYTPQYPPGFDDNQSSVTSQPTQPVQRQASMQWIAPPIPPPPNTSSNRQGPHPQAQNVPHPTVPPSDTGYSHVTPSSSQSADNRQLGNTPSLIDLDVDEEMKPIDISERGKSRADGLPPGGYFANGQIPMQAVFLDRMQDFAEQMQVQVEENRQLRNDMQKCVKTVESARSDIVEFRNVATSLRIGGPGAARKARRPQLLVPSVQAGTSGTRVEPVGQAADEAAKSTGHNNFLLAIRDHLWQLLKIKTWKQLSTRFPPLTEAEISAINEDSPDAVRCTIANFRVDFVHPWVNFPLNEEACSVFIEDFLSAVKHGRYKQKSFPAYLLAREQIKIALHNHMGHCRSMYRLHSRNTPEQVAAIRSVANKRKAMNSRKKTLRQSRLAVVVRRARLKPFMRLFCKMKARHMSGDETDGEEKTHPPVFRQIDAKWMSKELQTALHRLDDLYYDDWCHPSGDRRATSGNPPRKRLPSNGKSADIRAPKGLARNCYDTTWLKSLKPHVLESLGVLDEVWDLSIPDDIDKQPDTEDDEMEADTIDADEDSDSSDSEEEL